MDEIYTQAKDFLTSVISGSGLDLRITAENSSSGYILDMDGEDAFLLQSEGGELLDALEHLVNQIYGHKLPENRRLICDVNGFRAIRETELKAMARHVAERVKSTGVSYTFGPMNANERRIIHLSLSSDEGLDTESIGEGNNRRVKVSLKPSK
jgi:spoIIIJ-associated protein